MDQEQILVGDRFQTPKGFVWSVSRTRPGGVVELVSADRTLSTTKYTREVRLLQRLEGKDAKAIRLAQLMSSPFAVTTSATGMTSNG